MTAGWVRACLASLALLGACEPAGKDSAEGEAAQTGASIPAYGSLQWAVAGEWRTDQERARDTWRKPADTLSFFGVEGSDTVVELYPGGGWYTAVLGSSTRLTSIRRLRIMRAQILRLSEPPLSIDPKRSETSR